MAWSDILQKLGGRKLADRYQYSALEPQSTAQRPAHHRQQERLQQGKLKRLGAAVVFFAVLICAAYTYSQKDTAEEVVEPDDCVTSGNCTETSSHLWGQYSPWFPAPADYNSTLPEECELTSASVLSRHGSRYPTYNKWQEYNKTLAKIQADVSSYGRGYEFIKDVVFDLGIENLTSVGEQEMVESGTAFFSRYAALADGQEPFVRASLSDRVVASAQYFLQGFYDAQGRSSLDYLDDIVVIPEGDGYNNTLDHDNCPNFEAGPHSLLGEEKQSDWRETWAGRVANRLNRQLPGANLVDTHVILIMELCPFITVASPNATPSPFCHLFSEDEWRSYDYYASLGKWYAYGPGNPLGATQGVGYVNELIARLTGEPVVDDTTTNHTMDSSPATFPLDRKLYADFSHDNEMVSIYAALGLYNETRNLPTRYKVPPTKLGGFSASWTVPFAARMYVEKMRCSASPRGRGHERQTPARGSQEHALGRGKEETVEMVRILVNDRVVSLKGCDSDYLGRCELGDFVEALSFARSGGLWNQCGLEP